VNGLFLEFRDPLFGIIIFFLLVFIITLISYWVTRLRLKEETLALNSFVNIFRTETTAQELTVLLTSGSITQEAAIILAQSHNQNGNYEKCIEIYLILLDIQKDHKQKQEILFLLGKTYFQAGFLERSQEIFLQILKQFPRTPKALQYLLIIYEKMHQFDKALEVLEPLDELGIDNTKDRVYLEANQIIRSAEYGIEEKSQLLLELYQEHHMLSYLIYEYLFRHNPHMAWENLDFAQCERIMDILWNAQGAEANLDIISSNTYLRELYSAKGLVALAKESDVFEFDVLIKLNAANQDGATLQFDYLCGSCKQIYPFGFHRCPNCHKIDTVIIEALLTKDSFEDSYSLQ